MLREETRHLGILLIFDEVMTSRLAPQGGQEFWGITPDITALGKFWGGGFNFGAFGASRKLVSNFDLRARGTLSHAGIRPAIRFELNWAPARRLTPLGFKSRVSAR
jgi:glutamate-1-semialdehyde 2,1-aminomutase